VLGPFDKLQVGERDRYGNKISFIVGRTAHLLVYMVDGDNIAIDSTSDQQTERELEIVKVFNRLDSLITLAFQKRKASSPRYDLAGALYVALSSKDSTRSVNEYFADISEHITTRALDAARFVYVLSGFATAVSASLILYAFYISPWARSGTISATILGAIGGIIGSGVSIFARSNTIKISPFKQRVFTAFQGASRIALGALFGFVFVCCVKANILLGVLSDKTPGLFAFSILACPGSLFGQRVRTTAPH
jgi:hypothetical protein